MDNDITPYAQDLVHHKARQLIGKAGYKAADLDDIKQDLLVDLLERLPKFDPAKASYNTFVAHVVDKKICNLLRDRKAHARDHRREEFSLNDEIRDDNVQQRSAMIDCDMGNRRMGIAARPDEERTQLQMDIHAVLEKLPEELRQAAQLLQNHNVAEVARILKVPRRTFRDKYLAKLQKAFAAHGMEGYLA